MDASVWVASSDDGISIAVESIEAVAMEAISCITELPAHPDDQFSMDLVIGIVLLLDAHGLKEIGDRVSDALVTHFNSILSPDHSA